MTFSPELLAVLTVAVIQVFSVVWAVITYVDTHARLQKTMQTLDQANESLKAITAQAVDIVLQGRRVEDVLCEMREELKR